MISASEAGNSMNLMSGAPDSSFRSSPASSTRQPPISQSQCSQPLPKRQRPETA